MAFNFLLEPTASWQEPIAACRQPKDALTKIVQRKESSIITGVAILPWTAPQADIIILTRPACILELSRGWGTLSTRAVFEVDCLRWPKAGLRHRRASACLFALSCTDATKDALWHSVTSVAVDVGLTWECSSTCRLVCLVDVWTRFILTNLWRRRLLTRLLQIQRVSMKKTTSIVRYCGLLQSPSCYCSDSSQGVPCQMSLQVGGHGQQRGICEDVLN